MIFLDFFLCLCVSSVSTLAHFYTLQSDRRKTTRKRSEEVMMKAKLHDNSPSVYGPVDIYYSGNSGSLDILRDADSRNRLCSSLDTRHKI